MHSALALIVTLLSVAGLYLMLYAPFVAGVQIIVYAGGIMVLFLFVIMLVNVDRAVQGTAVQSHVAGRIGCGLPVAGAVYAVFAKGKALFPDRMDCAARVVEHAADCRACSTDKLAGWVEYTFAFEIASLLLLVAILGAVIMTKKKI